MSRSSARRGQAEPLAAVLSVSVVVAALGVVAPLFAAEGPESDPDLAGPTLERVHRALSVAGVVDPASLSSAVEAGPAGYRLRISLAVGDRAWTVGPPPSPEAKAASRPVSVRLTSGVVAGRLGVVVWE